MNEDITGEPMNDDEVEDTGRKGGRRQGQSEDVGHKGGVVRRGGRRIGPTAGGSAPSTGGSQDTGR